MRAAGNCAVALADVVADIGDGVIADARRIGTHVGDETHGAFVADLDAFIEALRDHHSALHAEAQLTRGFLLQGGSDERGDRIALLLARGHALDDVIDAGEPANQRIVATWFEYGVSSLALIRRALRTGFSAASRSTSTVQYSLLMKARISRSRSTMTRGHGLHAAGERPRRTLSHSRGEIL